MRLVDTHVHFWDRSRTELRYDWLDSDGSPLGDLRGIRVPRYAPADLRAEGRLHGLTKVVHMDAAVGTSDPVLESRWLEELAAESGWPDAFVASCDLTAPDADAQVARHAEHPRFRGVREMRPILAEPVFQRGLASLAARGGIFFHTVGPADWPVALELARRHPEMTFCLDQAGMPMARDAEYFAHWSAMLAGLAEAPNVVCKVSSLGMVEPGWTIESRRPWIRACVDAFGTDRCFFGSNWPIERKYSSYGDVVDAFTEAIGDLTEPERAALLAGNAERIFRI